MAGESEADREAPGILRRFDLDSETFASRVAEAVEHAAWPHRADSADLPWVPIGPRNVVGRIRALAIDLKTPSTLYAGSASGGVWKTTDEGETWEALDNFHSPDLPNPVRRAVPVGALAVSPSDPRVVYVGTGEPFEGYTSGSGLYRSEDGGATFAQIAPAASSAERFERIAIDPWEPDRCWIAGPKGLWRREPGGSFSRDEVVGQDDDVTDVVIDFGDPRKAQPPESGTFTVYAALRGKGIFRAIFHRQSAKYAQGAWQKLTAGLPGLFFSRIKLALCWAHPEEVYAIFEVLSDNASRVYRSTDGGAHWRKTAGPPRRAAGGQAEYNLLVEVHPDRPEVVFAGAVNLHRSLDGGESWSKIIDWERYDQGDRAQHADQHAVLFDPHDPRRVWVANDGGIVSSRNLGGTVIGQGGRWRRRGHGITAAQLYDVTTHPRHPSLFGGGFQDEGTWLSLGGPTWLRLDGADGGAMGFEPGDPRRFLVTWQGGLDRATLGGSQDDVDDDMLTRTLLPDRAAPGGGTAEMVLALAPLDVSLLHRAPFTGVLAHHPTRDDHALVGRVRAGFVTVDGTRFTELGFKSFLFSLEKFEVSALAYAPDNPDDVWWLGTSKGGLFVTEDGSQTPSETWRACHPQGIDRGVTSIAVHPTNSSIVAAAFGPDQVFLSGDGGRNWWNISGSGPTALGPSPVSCVAFDPRSDSDAAHDQMLYAGTLAGVYVIRNARAATAPVPPEGAPAPVWKTFNANLPLIEVTDLDPVVLKRDAAGRVEHALLRCATYGRGAFECDLAGAPPLRLYIRGTPVDDGRRYEGPAALTEDPRLPAPAPLDSLHAFDIRVDAPPFSFFFGSRMDGVEFDEELVPDSPVLGERNLVYVQVHNEGWRTAVGVTVRLFVAEALAEPPEIPDLPEDFWTVSDPAAPLGPWRLVGLQNVDIAPGQPVVAAFDWIPEPGARGAAALLALCSHDDDVPDQELSRVVESLVEQRWAAVRLVAFQPALYIRDGVDDDGRVGSVAWAGRSPDLIVVQAMAPDPGETFQDLADPRSGDRVCYGVQNHVYVRVHNRTSESMDAEVRLYRIPMDTLLDPSTWEQLGLEEVQIEPHGWKLTPTMSWTQGPAPASPDAGTCLLLAVAFRIGGPPPSFAPLPSLDAFWKLVGDRDAERSRFHTVALRGLRIEP
jgi:photosystem II stability/assembly factor-like uncharacterized protein